MSFVPFPYSVLHIIYTWIRRSSSHARDYILDKVQAPSRASCTAVCQACVHDSCKSRNGHVCRPCQSPQTWEIISASPAKEHCRVGLKVKATSSGQILGWKHFLQKEPHVWRQRKIEHFLGTTSNCVFLEHKMWISQGKKRGSKR